MLEFPLLFLRCLFAGLQSRSGLVFENLALRHQLAVLKRQARKPKLRCADRLLWVGLRRLWPQWQQALQLFQPQTIIGWHRLGFRLFWRWKSRTRPGRPCVDRDLLTLIQRMYKANPTWGSRRIQGELAKLGIEVSDSIIRKYRPKNRPSPSDQTWKSFLQNHAQAVVAVDFFAVPTATFRVLWPMSVAKSCISISLRRPRLPGQLSKWSKLSPTRSRRSICCGIAMPSMARISRVESKDWAWNKSSLPLALLGRIPWSKGSLARFAANVWTASSFSMRSICARCSLIIWPIITTIAATDLSTRIARSAARSKRQTKAILSPCRDWADCITLHSPGCLKHFFSQLVERSTHRGAQSQSFRAGLSQGGFFVSSHSGQHRFLIRSESTSRFVLPAY